MFASTRRPAAAIVLSVVAIVALATTPLRAQTPPPAYTLTDLSCFGIDTAIAINNRGQVLGNPASGPPVSILYEPLNNTSSYLPTLGGNALYAAGMNDYGQIIGSGQLPDGTFVPFLDSRGNIGPFSYSAGLPGPDLPFTVNHINSSWQMSGTVYLDLNGPLHALLYSLGNPLDLGTLGGTNSEALNLNDAGAVVGWSQTAGPNPSPRAFLFANGVMTDLGVLGHNPFSGPTFSIAYDVNNANQVVGASTTADGHVSPFLYDHGAMRDLGILDGGADGLALALNDAGQVVGYFTTDSTASQTHAFLFSDGVMRDLNDLVPAGSGWTLTSALGINNAGQIIGQGRYDGQSRAFLLTPVAVPLPRAAYPALATLAVAAVLPVARHRRLAQ